MINKIFTKKRPFTGIIQSMNALMRIYFRSAFPVRQYWKGAKFGARFIIQVLRAQFLQSVLGLYLVILIMKLWYMIINLLHPLLERLAPDYTRQLSYRFSRWFYQYLIPSPQWLLRGSYRIYRKM